MGHVDADHCTGSRSNSSDCNWMFELVIASATTISEDAPCTIVMLADDCSFVFAIAFVVDRDLVSIQHVSMKVTHQPYHALAFPVSTEMNKAAVSDRAKK